jgi:hypothetical protein
VTSPQDRQLGLCRLTTQIAKLSPSLTVILLARIIQKVLDGKRSFCI